MVSGFVSLRAGDGRARYAATLGADGCLSSTEGMLIAKEKVRLLMIVNQNVSLELVYRETVRHLRYRGFECLVESGMLW